MKLTDKLVSFVLVPALTLGVWGAANFLDRKSLLFAQSNPSPSAQPTIQEKIAFRRKTLQTMSDEIGQVQTAVKAKRFADAQATFEKALKKWYIFGGTIKRIDPSDYAKISPGFDSVKQGLYSSAIPLSKLEADIQATMTAAKSAVLVSDQKD